MEKAVLSSALSEEEIIKKIVAGEKSFVRNINPALQRGAL